MSATWADPEPVTDQQVDAANARVDYCLTYARTEPRRGTTFGLKGPEIPNAYPGSNPLGSGDWDDPDLPRYVTDEQSLIERWFHSAIREAMHEAMEWFRVDGKPLLDPHGPNEPAIHNLCGEVAEELVALARKARESGATR